MNNHLSEEREIFKGVPQGSVLSPLLFKAMQADFSKPDNGCKISLFADDVAIYGTTKTKEAAEEPLQNMLYQKEY